MPISLWELLQNHGFYVHTGNHVPYSKSRNDISKERQLRFLMHQQCYVVRWLVWLPILVLTWVRISLPPSLPPLSAEFFPLIPPALPFVWELFLLDSFRVLAWPCLRYLLVILHFLCSRLSSNFLPNAFSCLLGVHANASFEMNFPIPGEKGPACLVKVGEHVWASLSCLSQVVTRLS